MAVNCSASMLKAREYGSPDQTRKQQAWASTGYWDASCSNINSSSRQLPGTSALSDLQYSLPLTIPRALEEHCNIRARFFAMIYIGDDKKMRYETSPELSSRHPDIFTNDFRKGYVEVIRQEMVKRSSNAARRYQRQTPPKKESVQGHPVNDASISKPSRSGRNVPKARIVQRAVPASIHRKQSTNQILPPSRVIEESPCTASSEDEETASDDEGVYATGGTVRTEYRIGDEEAILDIYKLCFKMMQQLPCKTLAKCWVKTVEPKKQAHHPYNGGQNAVKLGKKGDGWVTRPDWWPKEGCRHKEPDHITKPERLVLLIHILRNLFSYDGTHGNRITVDLLRQSTDEIRGTPTMTPQVKSMLDLIYHVREQEERYLRDEIDASYIINIALPDAEPKEVPKMTKSKPATKRLRTQAPPSPLPQSVVSPVATEQHSPTVLVSRSTQVETNTSKQEPIPDESVMLYNNDVTQTSFKNEPIAYQSSGRNVSTTSSFSSMATDHPLQMNTDMMALPTSAYLPIQRAEEAQRLGLVPVDTTQHYPIQQPLKTTHSQQTSQTYQPFSVPENYWGLATSTQNMHDSSSNTENCSAFFNPFQTSSERSITIATTTPSKQTVSAPAQFNQFYGLPSDMPVTRYQSQPTDLSAMRRASTAAYHGLPEYNNVQANMKPYQGYH